MRFHLPAASTAIVLVVATTLAAQTGDEAAPRFRASALLAPDV